LDPLVVLATGFVLLFALLFLGLPIAFGLLLIGAGGFAAIVGTQPALAMVGQMASDTGLTYNFSVLPLFILMGNFVARSRLAEELYDAANAFLGHLPGGLAMATIVAAGGFSTVCGSSVACAATMTKVSVPTMRSFGYAPGFAGGTVAAGGTLGILIPPSMAMVLYAIITETDLGRLFIAGVVPGVLMIACYLVAIGVAIRIKPEWGPAGARSEWAARWRALGAVWGIVLLFCLVLGGIYFGVFTPTEAAGIGAAGAFLFAWLRGELGWRGLYDILLDSVVTSSMMFFVLIGALLFTNFVNVAGLPGLAGEWISGLGIGKTGLILLLVVIYLALGCILEPVSIMLLTVPVFFPITKAVGIDPIWFGIFLVVMIEVGLITPPIGMNVFVVKALLPDVPSRAIFAGVLPFLAADAVLISLIIAFPAIVLFLPDLMR